MYLFASEGDSDKIKISDCVTLETFLKCEQDREHKLFSSSPNVTGSPLSCDQYGSEFAPTPRKYHLSTRSLPSCLTEGDSLQSSDRIVSMSVTLCTHIKHFQTLGKLGISMDELSFWNDRCRKVWQLVLDMYSAGQQNIKRCSTGVM